MRFIAPMPAPTPATARVLRACLASLALGLVAAPLASKAQAADALSNAAAIGDAAQKAADQLTSKGKNKLLASAMIGREITGPGGETLGKVKDLVVVPGGQVLAVLVTPSGGGQPVALPYQALKVSGAAKAADQMGLSLPVGLKEVQAMQGMQALTNAVTGGG